MKKLLPLACLGALVAIAACTPSIDDTSPAPSGQIVAVFDPANNNIPLPNDLVPHENGHLAIPASPTDSAAQTELNTEYLDTLDNFPAESTATTSFSAELDPASVSDTTIIVLDITNQAAPTPVAVAPTYANKVASIAPPAGGWTRAHQYAVILKGGSSGLKGVNGEVVVGSVTWALVSGTDPLVTCQNQAALTGCTSAVDVIPGAGADFETQYETQNATAVQLETLRLALNPLLTAAAALVGGRENIPLAFTFTIADAGEVTFDPANNIIPFPNDLVRTGAGGTVSLPNPKTGAALTAADCNTTDTSILLVCGLNTLDGFSTQAPPVSENSASAGALTGGLIDPNTLSAQTVGLLPIVRNAPVAEQTAPNYTPCLNCLSSADATTGMVPATPQQLQWKLNAPLDEKTTYFGYVSTAVKDTTGKAVIPSPTFALLRLTSSLLDANGHSTVNIISDAQATQLEPIRLAYAPVLAGIAMQGVPATSLALGYTFTTQSEATQLDSLYGAPTLAGASGLIDYPTAVIDETTTIETEAPSLPHDKISKFAAVQYYSIVAVTGASGTFQPSLAGAKPQPINALVAVPSTPAPAGGYPVTIYGHGFTGSKADALVVMNALAAAGQVVIAPDVLFHGDRTTCTGSTLTGIPSDDASCANPTTMKCDEGSYTSTTNFGQGLCILRDDTNRMACAASATDPLGDGVCAAVNEGRCAADGKCQGANAGFLPATATASNPTAALQPAISGWNIFSLTNFFATRDNFRQQVIDLAQLVRVIKSTATTNLSAQLSLRLGAAITLDGTKINYVGQSLGGIMGTLFNAASPDTTNVVLNVPGGNLVSIIFNAPSFATDKAALLQGLSELQLIPGTPQFDQFLGFATWILDPADPANMGYRLTHGVTNAGGALAPPAARNALIQFIEGDQTVPNISNFALVAAANRTFNASAPPSYGCQAPLFCYEFTAAGTDAFDDTTAPGPNRHTFLRVPPSNTAAGLKLTTDAQTQAATFVAAGTLVLPQ